MQSRTKRGTGGRPPKFEREAVIESLSLEFRRRGYDAPTIAELASAAGINRPTLAASFGARPALYRLAAEHFAGRMRDALQDAFAGSDLRSSLVNFLSAVIAIYVPSDSDLRGCLVFSTAPASTSEPVVSDILREVSTELETSLRRELNHGAEDENSLAVPLECAVDLVTATIHSMTIRARAGADRAKLESLVSSLCQALFTPTAGNDELTRK